MKYKICFLVGEINLVLREVGPTTYPTKAEALIKVNQLLEMGYKDLVILEIYG